MEKEIAGEFLLMDKSVRAGRQQLQDYSWMADGRMWQFLHNSIFYTMRLFLRGG